MFGQRPSSLLEVSDPVVALALDEALAVRVLLDDARRHKEASSSVPGMLPDGQRYETPSEALSGRVH